MRKSFIAMGMSCTLAGSLVGCGESSQDAVTSGNVTAEEQAEIKAQQQAVGEAEMAHQKEMSGK